MPVSHYVRGSAPETTKQLLARGVCPGCGRGAIRYERGMDGCAGAVAVCRVCAWTDYDEQQVAYMGGFSADTDPGFATGFES